MSYSSLGYDQNITRYRGGTSDGPPMSNGGKVGFSIAVIAAILVSLLIAYFSVSRKQRAVAPDPSPPQAVHRVVDDEEQGRRVETTRAAAPAIAS